MLKKRGQITLFIIIGIVILFTVGFAIYMIQKPVFKITTKEETPIESYVRQCIENVGERGITVLASQGGYINVPDSIRANVRSYLALVPGGEPIIPYWYYRGQNNVPTTEFMQDQISAYVMIMIKSCIQNFEPFKQEFDISELGEISVDTVIGDRSVLIKLNYPIDVKDKVKGQVLRINSFSGEIPVSLGRMVSLAKKILATENKQTFFENETINLMAMNEKIPFSGLVFDCAPKTWRKSEIKKAIQEMLYWHIPRFKVEGTAYEPFKQSELYEKNHFIFKMTDSNYKDLNVAFRYLPEWGMDLRVRPNSGEILRSNLGEASNNFLLGLLCVNTWHFTYDIEYPLLAMIRDDSAFNGKGLIFNFAFPVLIDHNQGNRADMPIIDYKSAELSYEFCTDVSDQVVDIRAKDFYTLEDIYNANITYTCIIYTCDLGQTKPEAGSYKVKAKLPSSCTGGIFRANAPGYMEGIAVYDGKNYAEILMKPLKKLAVSYEKHLTNDFTKTREFTEKEALYLRIKGPEGYERYLSYPEGEQVIELIDGDATYDIDLLMIKNENIISGGYIGKWEVKYDDIINKEKVTFNVAEIMPVPISDIEQYNAITYLEDNQDYKTALKPTFS